MRLILASGSPRRRELLTRLGLSFSISKPDIDETPFPAEPADQYVARLSREKAFAVRNTQDRPNTQAADFDPDVLIIAADTTIALGDAILGKPVDSAEAFEMLTALRDKTHTVYTGITVCLADSSQSETRVTVTSVVMRAYSDSEMTAYIGAGEPFDKAGGYGIQHAVFQPAARIDGCYANVMGLPLCALRTMLAEYGVSIPQPFVCNPAAAQCAFRS